MSKADEIWRDIKGYENKYQISNLGNVRSLSRTIVRKNGKKQTFKSRVLKPCKNNKGYYLVSLDGKLYTIHRLVVENFMNNLVVNHKNGIKTDNRIENLELISQKDNCIKAWQQGLCENIRENAYNQKHKKQIKTSKAINQMDLQGNIINTFASIRDAERKTGINNTLIVGCCKGRHKTTHGYRFEYARTTSNK